MNEHFVGDSFPITLTKPERSYLQDVVIRLRRHKPASASVGFFALLLAWIIIGPLFSPYAPEKVLIIERLTAPSAEHIFGTDELGRDVAVRSMAGGRVSLMIGFATALITTVVGVIIGAISGYYGGVVDSLLMRFTDIMLSIPSLPLLLIMSRFVGGTIVNIVFILTIFGWMGLARIVRGNILSIKEREFVRAARVLGSGTGRIIIQHILPNTMAPIIVYATLNLGFAIIAESSLSYLGLGVQPPIPSWGNMLLGGQQYMQQAPWLAIIPGLFIFVTLLCVNFLGDGLRDALDPRMKI